VVIDDIPHFYLYTESRVLHSLSRITRNALAVMTMILFVALLRYILNQIVKSECQRPHVVGGHEEVLSNATMGACNGLLSSQETFEKAFAWVSQRDAADAGM
jgi:hypothetical protein